MDKLWNRMVDWGIETRGTLERMCGDYSFYRECLTLFVNDGAFHTLESAISEGNTEKAFDAAHTLKGVAANLGLTPFINDIVPFVESLRQGEFGPAPHEMMEKLFAYRTELDQLLGETM